MMTEWQPDRPGGFAQALPFPTVPGMTISGLISSRLPWGSPGILGLTGTLNDEPAVGVCYEWPSPWLRTREELKKDEMEYLHLQRYATDAVLATGALPFDDVRSGDNPPDFLATDPDGRELRIECTALAAKERREAYALFTQVRVALFTTPKRFLAHLTGFTIYMWFGPLSDLGRPFARSQQDAVNELINELARFTPDPEKIWVPAQGGLPEQMPDLGIGATQAGASFYAVPFTDALPATMLFAGTGFEVGLAFPTTHLVSTVWADVSRTVTQHDQDGVEWLLISAGAPNRRGIVHISEEALGQLLVAHPRPLARPPQHIERVTLHFWGTGQAVDLYPEVRSVFGPRYQGVAPPTPTPGAAITRSCDVDPGPRLRCGA